MSAPVVVKVTDVDLAFPAEGVKLTPPWETVPAEFKSSDSKWYKLASTWFYGAHTEAGKAKVLLLAAKPGIDGEDAKRMIQVCLGCYGTKHEHKMAGVAYLLATFYLDFAWINPTETFTPGSVAIAPTTPGTRDEVLGLLAEIIAEQRLVKPHERDA